MIRSIAQKGRAVMARLAKGGLWLSMTLLALMASMVVTQVVARNVFDSGLPWADELARFSGIAVVFLTVPLLTLRRDLVAVTLVPDLLPHRIARWLRFAAELSLLAFAVFLLWGFAAYLPRAGKFTTPAMGLPNWYYYAPALIGTVMLAASALLRAVETVLDIEPLASPGTPS